MAHTLHIKVQIFGNFMCRNPDALKAFNLTLVKLHIKKIYLENMHFGGHKASTNASVVFLDDEEQDIVVHILWV